MTDSPWKAYALMIEQIGTYRATRVSELLSVAGRVKAGALIVEDIERELAANNIGHFPPRIPREKNARVLLYNQDRAGLGFVMHMVRQLTEGQYTAGATADEQILVSCAANVDSKYVECLYVAFWSACCGDCSVR